MIPAGAYDLRNAFQRHLAAGKASSSASHNLLLFYATECGLKSIYLRRNKLTFLTSEMHKTDRNYPSNGHDLIGLIKALRLPASIIGEDILSARLNFKLRKEPHSTHQITSLHEVWRYGVLIDPTNEKDLINWINKINKNIKEWLNEGIP